MRNPSNLTFQDFVYNNNSLSEFGGIIAGLGGLHPFSGKPSETHSTEKITGRHGELFYNSVFNARTFEIPVCFEDMSLLRDIVIWLSASEPSKFYFSDDSVYINCMLDPQSIDFDHYWANNMTTGITELKFLCYDPFYYNLYDTKYTKNSNTDNLSNFTIFNDGNYFSYPEIKITGVDDVNLSLNGNSISLSNLAINNPILINSNYMTVMDSLGHNRISDFSGSFSKLILKAGNNIVQTSGDISEIQIQCNSRFI